MQFVKTSLKTYPIYFNFDFQKILSINSDLYILIIDKNIPSYFIEDIKSIITKAGKDFYAIILKSNGEEIKDFDSIKKGEVQGK